MNVKEAVGTRFMEIMNEQNMRANEGVNLSGVTPSTVYSMLDARRKEITINVIKKLCDGLDMPLGEFFSFSIFDKLEQEIRWAWQVRFSYPSGISVRSVREKCFSQKGKAKNGAPWRKRRCRASFIDG